MVFTMKTKYIISKVKDQTTPRELRFYKTLKMYKTHVFFHLIDSKCNESMFL